MAKKGLGRGLDLLIPKTKPEAEPAAVQETVISPEPVNVEVSAEEAKQKKLLEAQAKVAANSNEKDSSENIVSLKISMVEPNREQARKYFDDEALTELSESIKKYGVIQPIVVCKKEGFYEIIAGERRWRASKKAGLTEIPVVIRDYEDKERAEVSLIENIQRENLNPIEEAIAYKQLIDEYHMTQESLAERMSKSRTAITNTMRLLKLDEKVQQMVIDGKISGGHARALLTLEKAAEQIQAANKIVENKLNVRQTEEMVKELTKKEDAPARKKNAKKSGTQKSFKELEARLTEVLGTKVKINHKEKGGGKIEINYFSEDDLDRIYTCINMIKE